MYSTVVVKTQAGSQLLGQKTLLEIVSKHFFPTPFHPCAWSISNMGIDFIEVCIKMMSITTQLKPHPLLTSEVHFVCLPRLIKFPSCFNLIIPLSSWFPLQIRLLDQNFVHGPKMKPNEENTQALYKILESSSCFVFSIFLHKTDQSAFKKTFQEGIFMPHDFCLVTPGGVTLHILKNCGLDQFNRISL